LDLKLNGEEGDTSTYVLNGEWALLGMFWAVTGTFVTYRQVQSECFVIKLTTL
jgi:hypothetical protein